MWSDVLKLFQGYMGTGLLVAWFLISVGYLLIKEKRKHIRILFLYVPIILLLLFFNPLFAKAVYAFSDGEIYYRILWLIPFTVVIAFGAVTLFGEVKGKVRIGFVAAASVLIMLSGSFIYQNTYFSRAENLYHVPDSVVNICDSIRVPGREVKAIFPAHLLQYVRQYDPTVCMPYGRETVVARWGLNHELYDIMEADTVVVESLVTYAAQEQCHYVILEETKPLEGKLEDYGYEVFGKTDGYVIYRNLEIPLEIPVVTE